MFWEDLLWTHEPSFTLQSTTIVISGSPRASRCNQLCGKDAQRRYKANNDNACRVCTYSFYSFDFLYFFIALVQYMKNACFKATVLQVDTSHASDHVASANKMYFLRLSFFYILIEIVILCLFCNCLWFGFSKYILDCAFWDWTWNPRPHNRNQ